MLYFLAFFRLNYTPFGTLAVKAFSVVIFFEFSVFIRLRKLLI